jgi:hypothetical protein
VTNLVTYVFEHQTLGFTLCASLITLIPKRRLHELLKNWHPISPLNSIYKILAKTLTLQMQPHLTVWICTTQTAYIPGRCILDNIYLAQEAIQYAPESNQNLALLLLDFEKAFDRISWTFMEQALKALGFCEL